jgi:hypothetical protein
VSPDDLPRWREQRVVEQRKHLRERYAYLTARIREAEAAGEEGRAVVKQLRTLLAFVIRDANLLDRDEAVRALRPKAAVGEKFTAGRKKGSVGRLRMWVRTFIGKYPTASAAQAWAALAKRPPKGFTVVEGFRAHVWVDGAGETGLARFKNIVSEERRAMK